MDRLKFLNNGGKRILLVDCSNCGPDELVEIFDEAEHLIHGEAHGSIMTLVDFTGAQFNKQAADRLKIVAAKDKPYVHRSAFVGAESIPEVFYNALQSFSVRKFPGFRTREEALTWLVQPDSKAAAS